MERLYAQAAPHLQLALNLCASTVAPNLSSAAPPNLRICLLFSQAKRIIVALNIPPRERSAVQHQLVHRVTRATNALLILDPLDQDLVTKRLRHEYVQPNAVLMQDGDDADRFFIVLRGQLQVSPSARTQRAWSSVGTRT